MEQYAKCTVYYVDLQDYPPYMLRKTLVAASLAALVVSPLHPAARLEPALQLSTIQHYITRLHHKHPPPTHLPSHFAVSPPRKCHPAEEIRRGQTCKLLPSKICIPRAKLMFRCNAGIACLLPDSHAPTSPSPFRSWLKQTCSKLLKSSHVRWSYTETNCIEWLIYFPAMPHLTSVYFIVILLVECIVLAPTREIKPYLDARWRLESNISRYECLSANIYTFFYMSRQATVTIFEVS